ncbi:MAG: ATP-binding protein [Bacteroidota bacterium]
MKATLRNNSLPRLGIALPILCSGALLAVYLFNSSASTFPVLLSIGLLALTLFAYRKSLAFTSAAKGLLFLSVTFLLIWVASRSRWWRSLVPDNSWFEAIFESTSSPALWDLSWNTLFVFLSMVYFHKRIQLASTGDWPIGVRSLLSVGIYLSIGLGLQGIGLLFQSFILEAAIPFNFDTVLLMSWPALLIISSGLVLLMSFFLFTLRMMEVLHQLAPSQRLRLRSLAASLLLIGLLQATLIGTTLWWPIQLLLVLLYLLISDLYTDYNHQQQSITWGIVWIFIFSLFASVHLFSAHLHKDKKERVQMAQALGVLQDSIAEHTLEQLVIANQLDVEALLAQPYLFENYEFQRLTPSPSIDHITLDSAAYYAYQVPLANGQAIRLKPKLTPSNPFLKAAQLSLPLKGLSGLEQYKIYIARKGSAVLTNSVAPSTIPTLPAQTYQEQLSSKRAVLFYQKDATTQIMVAKDRDGYLQPISLFSLLFVLLSIIVVIWSWEVQAGGWLSGALLPFGDWNSLQNRIQRSFLGLFILSFFLMGALTLYFSTQTYSKQFNAQLGQSIRQIKTDIEERLQAKDSLQQALAFKLSEAHGKQLFLYNQNGEVVGSSMPPLLAQSHFPPAITAQQQTELQQKRNIIFVANQLGTEQLTTALLPIQQDEQVWGYLGLPYFQREAQNAPVVYTLISNLLNFYVAFLLFTVAVAVAFAKYITAPISQLGNRLKAFSLGKNELIPWNRSTEDEIGELIGAYNNMVEQLEASTQQLKRQEREGAWREMAKQVAHEIKNPLTPMKLSIQHLKRAYQAQPDQVEPLLKRVSNTLIEQIDGLTRIASDFSNFAKMPAIENAVFELNAVTQSVVDLFKNHPQATVSARLPVQPLHVFADREQVVRVLNNLIKNAIQAIPEARAGTIEVHLLIVDGAFAQIQVQDNGSGIPTELQDKVFYPNFTTKSSGSGLGLAISKNVIEASKGRIYFETVPDEGTTFFVELPLHH